MLTSPAAVNRGGHSSAPRPDNAIYAVANALTAPERHRFAPMINDAHTQPMRHFHSGQYGEVRRFLADPPDLLEAMDSGSTRTVALRRTVLGGHAPNALPQKAEAGTLIAGFSPVSKSKKCANNYRRFQGPMSQRPL